MMAFMGIFYAGMGAGQVGMQHYDLMKPAEKTTKIWDVFGENNP